MLMPISALRPVLAGSKDKFTLAVSIYTGWMPWYYANEEGIIQKWAKRNGINIDVQYMDYLPSVQAFSAGAADAVVMTNMEALNMPAASGVDTTVLIIGDYSNGNDAILVRDGLDVPGLKGQEIYLVELSVSHYLLDRALTKHNLKERDVKIINTSDATIGPAFIANPKQKAIVTWNPIVMEVEQTPGITKIFDSSHIPGEILDVLGVNTNVLKQNPAFAEALVGSWYEVMSIMSKRGRTAEEAKAKMAEQAGATLNEFNAQLRTTAMLWTPKTAAAFIKGEEVKQTMDFVRNFCFEHGLLGENVPSADVIGIQFPDGTILGNKGNVKLRFDATYVERAAQAG